MNWLFKMIIFSAPIFIVTLVIYFSQHKMFERDFQTENVRLEQQFQKEWNDTNATDEFLEKQKKLARRYWKESPTPEEEMSQMEKELHQAIEEAEKERGKEEKNNKKDRVIREELLKQIQK